MKKNRMHPKIEEKIISFVKKYKPELNSVLEVGATYTNNVLRNNIFKNTSTLLGVNLKVVSKKKNQIDSTSYEILQQNANNMDLFEDGSFDVVISNAMLEHDKFFWRSVKEMKRVLKKNGVLIVGVPGFDKGGNKNSTMTFIHHGDVDYYRFGEDIFRDFIFADMDKVLIQKILKPVRIVGVGIKK